MLIILSFAHSFSLILGSVALMSSMTAYHFQVFKITIFKSIIVIMLLFFLVPKFQMEGAALALAIGIVLDNLLNYILLYRKFNFIPYDRDFWKVGITILFSSLTLIFSFNYFSNYIFDFDWYWLLLFIIYAYFITIIFLDYFVFHSRTN